MTASDFWSNKERAQATIDETAELRSKVNPLAALMQRLDDLEVLVSLAREEKESESQASAFREVEQEYAALLKELKRRHR